MVNRTNSMLGILLREYVLHSSLWLNEPLLRSGRMWTQVGLKIHRLKFGTLAFALQKAPGLARTYFCL